MPELEDKIKRNHFFSQAGKIELINALKKKLNKNSKNSENENLIKHVEQNKSMNNIDKRKIKSILEDKQFLKKRELPNLEKKIKKNNLFSQIKKMQLITALKKKLKPERNIFKEKIDNISKNEEKGEISQKYFPDNSISKSIPHLSRDSKNSWLSINKAITSPLSNKINSNTFEDFSANNYSYIKKDDFGNNNKFDKSENKTIFEREEDIWKNDKIMLQYLQNEKKSKLGQSNFSKHLFNKKKEKESFEISEKKEDSYFTNFSQRKELRNENLNCGEILELTNLREKVEFLENKYKENKLEIERLKISNQSLIRENSYLKDKNDLEEKQEKDIIEKKMNLNDQKFFLISEKYSKIKKDLENAKKDNNERESFLETEKQKFFDLENENYNLTENLKNKEDEISTILENNDILYKKIHILENELEIEKKENDNFVNIELDLENKNFEIEDFKIFEKNLKKKIEKKNLEIEDLVNDIKNKDDIIFGLEKKILFLEDENKMVKNNYYDLFDKMKITKKEIKNKENEFLEKLKINPYEKEYKKILNNFQHLENENKNILSLNQFLENENKNLNEKLEKNINELNLIKNFENKIENEKALVYKSEKNNIEKKFEKLKSENKNIKQNLNEKNFEMKNIKKENNKYKKLNDEKNILKNELEEKLELLIKKNKKLKKNFGDEKQMEKEINDKLREKLKEFQNMYLNLQESNSKLRNDIFDLREIKINNNKKEKKLKEENLILKNKINDFSILLKNKEKIIQKEKTIKNNVLENFEHFKENKNFEKKIDLEQKNFVLENLKRKVGVLEKKNSDLEEGKNLDFQGFKKKISILENKILFYENELKLKEIEYTKILIENENLFEKIKKTSQDFQGKYDSLYNLDNKKNQKIPEKQFLSQKIEKKEINKLQQEKEGLVFQVENLKISEKLKRDEILFLKKQIKKGPNFQNSDFEKNLLLKNNEIQNLENKLKLYTTKNEKIQFVIDEKEKIIKKEIKEKNDLKKNYERIILDKEDIILEINNQLALKENELVKLLEQNEELCDIVEKLQNEGFEKDQENYENNFDFNMKNNNNFDVNENNKNNFVEIENLDIENDFGKIKNLDIKNDFGTIDKVDMANIPNENIYNKNEEENFLLKNENDILKEELKEKLEDFKNKLNLKNKEIEYIGNELRLKSLEMSKNKLLSKKISVSFDTEKIIGNKEIEELKKIIKIQKKKIFDLEKKIKQKTDLVKLKEELENESSKKIRKKEKLDFYKKDDISGIKIESEHLSHSHNSLNVIDLMRKIETEENLSSKNFITKKKIFEILKIFDSKIEMDNNLSDLDYIEKLRNILEFDLKNKLLELIEIYDEKIVTKFENKTIYEIFDKLENIIEELNNNTEQFKNQQAFVEEANKIILECELEKKDYMEKIEELVKEKEILLENMNLE